MSAPPPRTRVRCPFCLSREGEQCVTASGGVRRDVHLVRWAALRSAYLSRTSRLRMLHDDLRFGLAAGDVLVCVPYPYDEKWTVLRRESDGFDPECNQYVSDVEWIGWAGEQL